MTPKATNCLEAALELFQDGDSWITGEYEVKLDFDNPIQAAADHNDGWTDLYPPLKNPKYCAIGALRVACGLDATKGPHEHGIDKDITSYDNAVRFLADELGFIDILVDTYDEDNYDEDVPTIDDPFHFFDLGELEEWIINWNDDQTSPSDFEDSIKPAFQRAVKRAAAAVA